ncbi:MAG: right-handed parallel beta-helix repeat-containing protein, partial [Planctomycetota bacterium]
MKKIFFPAAFLFAISAICFSETIHVPGDYPSIRYAVQIAQEGDEVIVEPGTYVENIIFQGRNITLKSSSGPEVTVIDGKNPSPQDWGSVVIFNNHERADCVLEGFTLINGSGTSNDKYDYSKGGGIYCNGASPTLRNLIITKNSAISGGGIYCDYDSKPTMIDLVIIDNSASMNAYSPPEGIGGGIACCITLTDISNLYICGNKATFGGGIGCSSAAMTISNNTICENMAEDGGGIWSYNATVSITNNTISNNLAGNGGGIYNAPPYYQDGFFAITVRNNTFTQNSANHDGGGLWLECGDNSIVSGNIITDNSAGSDGGGLCVQKSSPHFKNNVIIGNASQYRGGGLYVY